MRCPSCRFESPEEMRFCGNCGRALNDPAEQSPQRLTLEEKLNRIQPYIPKSLTKRILAQKDKIEGERRQVTILFCDMAGFTSLTEKLGPEETFVLMDRVFGVLIHKIHRYEGTVNELRGDGILALFGAPLALEEAPQRAVQASIAIHKAIHKLNQELKGDPRIAPISLRIGVNTGPVVVGSVGNDLRVHFTAVGDTINMASRMEKLAEPGTTFVTESTYKLTRDRFQFEALGRKPVKGKKDPLPVYKVVSQKEEVHRPRLGPERMIYAEMVGRDRELARLELHVMKAVNGEGSIVNIVGEAGIGKSRLISELKKRAVMDQALLLEGRALSIGRNLSFHPIVDLLKQWAGIKEDDTEDVALDKLRASVRKVCSQDVHEVLPFVATLMGMRLSGGYAARLGQVGGEGLQKLIFKHTKHLLSRISRGFPLVVVMEDIHWADTSSIELLESLFRLVETERVLFVNVLRPGHGDTGDRLVRTVAETFPEAAFEIPLQSLDARMSEALVHNMLEVKGVPHGLIDRIVERSGGNPFFIEEVVRSFIDEGAVVVRRGRFEVTDKINQMSVPHSIIDVLTARVDRLDEKTRELVRVASVIGRNFFYRVLTEVAKTIEDIDNRLSYLKDIQLIRERRRMEELEYLFKHALAQEAAYETILIQRRKDLHLKVANSIEKVFRGRLHEFYGMLAYHYAIGEDGEKAEEYLIKAGEEALLSSASSEALRYSREALNLYEKRLGSAIDPEKAAMIERNIALAFFNRGQLENARDYFEMVLTRWGAGSPKNRILVFFKVISDWLRVAADLYIPAERSKKAPGDRDNEIFEMRYKKAVSLVHLDPERCFVEYLSTLRELTRFDISQTQNGVEMWVSGAGLFSWTGISFRLSKRMLDYCRGCLDPENVKQVLFYDLFELLHQTLAGNWPDTKPYDDALAHTSLETGEFWHVSTMLLMHGYIQIGRGCFAEAQQIIQRLHEISKEYDNENGREYWFTLRITLMIVFRSFNDALKEVETGIAFLNQTGRDPVLLYYHGLKAVIHVHLRDFHAAREALEQACQHAPGRMRTPPIYMSSFLLGRFLLDLGLLEQSLRADDAAGIRRHRRQAVRSGSRALGNARKCAFDRVELLRLMGRYRWLTGEQSKASRMWQQAVQEAERMGARVELARTYGEIGRRLREPKSRCGESGRVEASGYLARARALFDEIGLFEDGSRIGDTAAPGEAVQGGQAAAHSNPDV
jgi:class 3 adenylate cyclase/tetratricopeptide (TPR) repeat protein